MKATRKAQADAASLLQRLRRRGLRVTAQRRVIAEALQGAHVHLTAEQVFERSVAMLPEISRATVYNTLNQLQALGEVRELALDPGPTRYDPNAAKPHQHLICDRCGMVRDVVPLGDIRLPLEQQYQFTISDRQVIFRGLCPACAGRRRQPKRKRAALASQRRVRR